VYVMSHVAPTEAPTGPATAGPRNRQSDRPRPGAGVAPPDVPGSSREHRLCAGRAGPARRASAPALAYH
jgi:hypothetical protein